MLRDSVDGNKPCTSWWKNPASEFRLRLVVEMPSFTFGLNIHPNGGCLGMGFLNHQQYDSAQPTQPFFCAYHYCKVYHWTIISLSRLDQHLQESVFAESHPFCAWKHLWVSTNLQPCGEGRRPTKICPLSIFWSLVFSWWNLARWAVPVTEW